MNYHLSYSDWYGDKNFEANHFQLACQELTFIAWGWRQSSPRLSGETFGQTRIDPYQHLLSRTLSPLYTQIILRDDGLSHHRYKWGHQKKNSVYNNTALVLVIIENFFSCCILEITWVTCLTITSCPSLPGPWVLWPTDWMSTCALCAWPTKSKWTWLNCNRVFTGSWSAFKHGDSYGFINNGVMNLNMFYSHVQAIFYSWHDDF